MKLRSLLFALVMAIAVGVGSSQATITPANLTLSTSSSSAVVSGSTLYYSKSGGSFTVAVNDTTDAAPLTIDFPSVFGDNPASGTTASHTYSWTSGTTDSGSKTVSVTDAGGGSQDHQFTITPDTPTVSNTSPSEITGAGDQYWSSGANTLWFRPGGAGSFTLNATAADAVTGIARVDFPGVSGSTGWSGSTGGTDPDTPYASPVSYAWTAGASAPGAKQVTATNNVGLTATSTITISADSTAPTDQTIALNGGPWYASASVPLTIGQGSDAGAGVDRTRGVVERASALLTNAVCGTFGTFAAVAVADSADTSVTSGSCYRYQYKATDNVGNVSTASAASADAKVDATAPTAPSLHFIGFSNTASSGNVVYYRPTGSGAFTVTAASSDTESGVASYSFPTVPGFTAIGSGASRTYSYSTAAGAPTDPLSVTATNGAGLTSAAASFKLVADATPPTVTVRCNGRPCRATTYPKAVTITATATDGAGSGVDAIRYTVDGANPTPDGGIEYVRGFAVRTLMHLKVRAFDKAGNASKVVALTIRSAADRLVFAAPSRVTVTTGARYLFVKVTSSHRAIASVTMAGPKLKRPRRWHFILSSGTSIVQFRLPTGLSATGGYKVVWAIQAGTQKASKTTQVVVGLRKA